MIPEIGPQFRDESFSGFLVFADVIARFYLLHGQMQFGSGDDVVIAETLSIRQNFTLMRIQLEWTNLPMEGVYTHRVDPFSPS